MLDHQPSVVLFPPIESPPHRRIVPLPAHTRTLQQRVDAELVYLAYLRRVLEMRPGPPPGRLRQINIGNTFRSAILADLQDVRYPAHLIAWLDIARALARQVSDRFDECALAIERLRSLAPDTPSYRRQLDEARGAIAVAYQRGETLNHHITHLLDELPAHVSALDIKPGDASEGGRSPTDSAPERPRQAVVIHLANHLSHH